MADEKEFEHDVDFDDLRGGSSDDFDTEVDLETGEADELDTGESEPPEGDEPPSTQAAAEDDLNLDELLPPAPTDDRFDKLETQLTEQQIADRRTQFVNTTQSKIATLTSEADNLRQQLREARENGKTDDELRLEEELADKRLDLREQKRALQWYESDDFKTRLTEEVKPKPDPNDPAAQREAFRRQLEQKPAMAQWLNKNRWFVKPANAEQRAAAALVNGLEEELSTKGLKNGDPKFYAEVNKRLAKSFPDLVKVEKNDSATPTGGGENGGHRRSSGKRVVITADDKRAMRQFGMDPSNPAHLREWAADKRKEQRRG